VAEGITKLSELTIDVDKDWLGYVIKNLGAPVASGDALRLPWDHASRHEAGGADALTKAGLDGILEHWTKIAEVYVDADTTTITITGLDLDADKAYLVVLNFINPQATGSIYHLHFNNDLTDANYKSQRLIASGTGVSAGTATEPDFAYLPAGESTPLIGLVGRVGAVPRFHCRSMERATCIAIKAVHWDIAANVTRIDIHSTTANAIGAGSRLMLFKVSG